MVLITDKFGKASINSDYAVATTVKTTRTAGGTVLDAYDLSKFAPDTPVHVVTYKKTIDPVTNAVSISNLISWKAIVNVGANTLTNLTLAPGYVDSGNDVGDFIECIPTSMWVNDLIDGIQNQHNADGSHKGITTDTITATSGTFDNLTITGTPTAAGWEVLGGSVSAITANGNHSYNMTIPGVDKTGTISPGMRLLIPRTVAPPTQCATLNGTSQYFSKSSPAGMTFTDDFVVSAWIKLTSYGVVSTIASRYNGTSGWSVYLSSSGQLSISGYNGGASNISSIQAYQSIPLNKWVHIAAQLDMSTFSTTPTTSYVMIDGVDVPGLVSRGGTNPTALVQAGNLEIGSQNGGTLFFPGKIAQVAIYSAKVTQATILASMNQGLTGSETNLVSAYSLSNSLNDLNTSNANNLTANAGATTTTVDSPFNATEYGIVMSTSFSTDTTLTVQVPEGYSLPVNGGVGAVQYSGLKVPYGFPAAKGKWRIFALFCQARTVAWAGGVWANSLFSFMLPPGTWELGFEGMIEKDDTSANVTDVRVALSTTLGTPSNLALSSGLFDYAATTFMSEYVRATDSVTVTTPTVYYNLQYIAIGSSVTGYYGSSPTVSRGDFKDFADNAYL